MFLVGPRSLYVFKFFQVSAVAGINFKKELKKQHPQFDVLHCHLCPSQLPKSGDVIGRIMKRRLEQIDEKDANVRQVDLKPIIMEVSKEVVGILKKALVPCWGGLHRERTEKNVVGDKSKNS